jgi:hypothetical protein
VDSRSAPTGYVCKFQCSYIETDSRPLARRLACRVQVWHANLPDRLRVNTPIYLHCIRHRSRIRLQFCWCVCKRPYKALEKIKAFFYAHSVSNSDHENILCLKKSYFQLRQNSAKKQKTVYDFFVFPHSSFVFSIPLKNDRSRFYCICSLPVLSCYG